MASELPVFVMKLFVIALVILGGLYYWYHNFYKQPAVVADTTKTAGEEKNEHENLLDIQFSRENMPLVVYRDMFTKSAPWIGGYDIGIGKTIISQAQKAK